MPGWEDNLLGRCAGEQVAAVVDKQLFFIMDIAVITRVLAPALPTSHYFCQRQVRPRVHHQARDQGDHVHCGHASRL